MDIKCRCCLTCNKGVYHSLLSVYPGLGKKNSSVLDVLQIVTSSQVAFSVDLPTDICQGCLKNLKTSFGFLMLFKNSQIQLNSIKTEHTEIVDSAPKENLEIVETVEIKVEIEDSENEDIFDDSTTEQIIIVSEFDGSSGETFGEKHGDMCFEVDETNLENIGPAESTFYINDESCEVPVDEAQNFDSDSKKSTIENEEVIRCIKMKEEESEEETLDLKDVPEYLDLDFKQDLLVMEKNRKKNKENITIMTIEDVLQVEKRNKVELRVEKRNKLMKVEDVVNTQKKADTRPRTRLRKDQTPGTFICNLCENVFSCKRNLIIHKYRLHNPNWREKFKCTVCELECKTFSSLKHHMHKHGNSKPCCHVCGKQYLTKAALTLHIKTAHEHLYDNKYVCALCGKGLKSKAAMKYHLQNHNNQRNYMCRFCGAKMLTLTSLKLHERTHTGERPYTCRYCDKTFAVKGGCRKHEQIHSGIRPYPCPICDKGFITPYHMKVHLQQHRGDYHCTLCDRSFIDEEILKFHCHFKHKIMPHEIVEKNDDSE